jgi:uncharacterized protein
LRFKFRELFTIIQRIPLFDLILAKFLTTFTTLQFEFQNHIFQLLPEKALFWEIENTLILADLHLGKTGHFRKEGLAIPNKSIEKDYQVLNTLLTKFKPKKVLILGDLFHSIYNTEWEKFANFINQNSTISFELVIGNHDILPKTKYSEIGLINLGEAFIYQNLIFTHHPLELVPDGCLNFSGHVHPGVRIEGIGRQSISMPCFYRKNTNFILPAFGSLTGLKILQKEKTTEIYGVSGSKIFKI